MYPVIISVGGFAISSFGLFLSVGFLSAIYVIWRLCRVYDIDEERTLDISLITFLSALLGARVSYVIFNFNRFDSLAKVVFLNHFPGLYFWGGVIFGLIGLILGCRYFKLSFYQIADFIIVGVFASLIFGSVGCLLSGCQAGFGSGSFLAVTQVGLLAKRFPTQVVDGLFFFLSFLYLRKVCLRFHFSGKALSLGLVFLGLVKFLTDYLRDSQPVFYFLTLNQIFSTLLFLFGLYIFYRQSKRSLQADANFLTSLVYSEENRRLVLLTLSRNWYNLSVNLKIGLNRFYKSTLSKGKVFLRSKNVKFNTPKLEQD